MYSIPKRILFAFRALKSNRLCSCISILGLGLGLACFIVIVKYVWLEYTTDTAQRNYHRIYCTVSQASEIDIPCLSEIINCSDRLADYPEVEARTRVSAFDGEQLSVENRLRIFSGFRFSVGRRRYRYGFTANDRYVAHPFFCPEDVRRTGSVG